MLLPVLKSKSKGYQPKKARTFDQRDLEKFINEADDETYLLMKIVIVILRNPMMTNFQLLVRLL